MQFYCMCLLYGMFYFLQSVLIYDIYGDGDGVTQFRIDPATGVITLTISQLNNNVNSYLVSKATPLLHRF